ncbi:MAG: hypothetical protein ACOYN0_12880, partial [Phycisphaerales bacterium]
AAGRDAAIQSEGGDGAAVFFFEPGGRLSIVPCVQVATIRDSIAPQTDPLTGLTSIDRDVFVPVPNSEPVQLPEGWVVRGYASPGSFDNGASDPNGWYEGPMWTPRRALGNWVFPETGFYDRFRGDQGRNRQTFMIRFKKATGEIEGADRRTCLVVDLSPDDDFRVQPPWSDIPRLDRAEDLPLAVRRVASLVNDAAGLPTSEARWLGDVSSDTVLTRPVTELALHEEASLARAMGFRGVNRVTKCLYDSDTTNPALPAITPVLDDSLFPTGVTDPAEVVDMINRWLEGRLVMSGGNGEPVASDARLFTFQHYAGQVEEISP